MRAFLRHGLYPLLMLWMSAWLLFGISHPESMKASVAVRSGVMIGGLLVLEGLYPYRKEWAATWSLLLRRDLFFIAVNGAVLVGIQVAFTWAAIDYSAVASGRMGAAPLLLQVTALLVVFEALQYTIHRVMHLGGSPLLNFLWRTHAIHHLPKQLYLVMHAVGHPINALIIRLLAQVPPILFLGPSPEAVFVSSAIVGLHGTISHTNLDLRMGLANYLFVGPELHRYHHSARTHEAQNFGATLSIFDLLFKTFLYRPGTPPEQLGLSEEEGYPGQADPIRSLLFPGSLKPVQASAGSLPKEAAPFGGKP